MNRGETMINDKMTVRIVGDKSKVNADVWAFVLVDMMQAASEIKSGWDEVIYEISEDGSVSRLSSWISSGEQ
jgi:hypothetical protein